MPDVRPVGPEHFDQVYPLLLEFANSAMSRDDWRRMLFDLPWSVSETHRGYALFENDRVVGFLGTIFSERQVGSVRRRVCNLSSWIVKPSHRSSSFLLLLPVLSMTSHTIVNLSASPSAHEIFRGLGFRTLEDRQALLVPVPLPGEIVRLPRTEALLDPGRVLDRLDAVGRRIFEDMRRTLAAQVLLIDGDRTCHVVATRSPWKARLQLAHVQYASDWMFLADHGSLAAWSLHRQLGTVGLRIDGRRLTRRAPPFSVRRTLRLPHLYRPAESDITPDQIDGLYTEAVNQRW